LSKGVFNKHQIIGRNDVSELIEFKNAAIRVEKAGEFLCLDTTQLQEVIDILPLSGELLDWYRNAAPIDLYIPWHGNDLFLYDPRKLVEYQQGYRWRLGNREKTDYGWQQNWVVIGDIGGDPIIADISEEETPIYFALHGASAWQPKIIAPSLRLFLSALIIWLNIVKKYENSITEEDGSLLRRVKSDMEFQLSSILSRSQIENLMYFLE
jgi:hypothetical protein